MQSKSNCSIDGCEKTRQARGLCPMHLRRLRVHGTTEFSRVSPETRFWGKVQKGEGCWEWQGHLGRNGYGLFLHDGLYSGPHRFSWELHYGPIPAGMHVCHHCDNPPCVRPDHLFLGTPLDNIRDMAAKGRRATLSGEKSATAKLGAEAVRLIRVRYAAGGITQKQLATEFGMGHTAIGQIVLRQSWRNV
jgi:hypothetical protein